MSTNEILKKLHDALVAKAQERVTVEGKAKVVTEIGNAIIDYGRMWTEGLADDGRISNAERAAIDAKFASLVDSRVPSAAGVTVRIAWNGLSLFGIGWKGLKHYCNKWFGLRL